MKKLGYVIAALGAIIIAAPSIASAETVVIKRGGYHGHHHGYGARAEYRAVTAATIADGGMSSRQGRGHQEALSLSSKHAEALF